jgi:hypothetical protein
MSQKNNLVYFDVWIISCLILSVVFILIGQLECDSGERGIWGMSHEVVDYDVWGTAAIFQSAVFAAMFARSCWDSELNRRKDERAKAGQCIVCGYDLRETRDCCPECGTVPERLDDC